VAFPQITGSANSSRASNNVTDPVTLPASIVAGDLVIVFHFSDTALTRTFPAPWVEIIDSAYSGGNCNCGVAYLIASGGETSVTVTKSTSERFTALAIKISAASWHGTTPPYIAGPSEGASTIPDPPSATAPWGSADNLFIALTNIDNHSAEITAPLNAYPATYTDNHLDSDYSFNSASSGSIATRNYAGATDNPGTFTINTSDQWQAFTLIVRPKLGADVSVAATRHALTLTEYSATVDAAINVQANAASLTITANAATISANITFIATRHALTLTEYTTTVNAAINVQATTDTFTITAYTATISEWVDIDATVDTFTLTTYPAIVNIVETVDVDATTVALTLTEYTAAISEDYNILATVASLTLTEYAATISADITFTTTVDALTITAFETTVNAATEVSATCEVLSLTEYKSRVAIGRFVPVFNSGVFISHLAA